jgi:hypothetical protein
LCLVSLMSSGISTRYLFLLLVSSITTFLSLQFSANSLLLPPHTHSHSQTSLRYQLGKHTELSPSPSYRDPELPERMLDFLIHQEKSLPSDYNTHSSSSSLSSKPKNKADHNNSDFLRRRRHQKYTKPSAPIPDTVSADPVEDTTKIATASVIIQTKDENNEMSLFEKALNFLNVLFQILTMSY